MRSSRVLPPKIVGSDSFPYRSYAATANEYSAPGSKSRTGNTWRSPGRPGRHVNARGRRFAADSPRAVSFFLDAYTRYPSTFPPSAAAGAPLVTLGAPFSTWP